MPCRTGNKIRSEFLSQVGLRPLGYPRPTELQPGDEDDRAHGTGRDRRPVDGEQQTARGLYQQDVERLGKKFAD